MKKLIFLLLLAAASCTERQEHTSFVEYYPMPEYYRKITGMDSIEMLQNRNTIEISFTNPNKWEFEKFKKDTVFIHDTIYSTRHYDNVGTVIIDQR